MVRKILNDEEKNVRNFAVNGGVFITRYYIYRVSKILYRLSKLKWLATRGFYHGGTASTAEILLCLIVWFRKIRLATRGFYHGGAAEMFGFISSVKMIQSGIFDTLHLHFSPCSPCRRGEALNIVKHGR
jgi:hypothetical protein